MTEEGLDLYEAAASAASRVLLYPSLAYNMARSKLDTTWEWHTAITEEVILGALPLPSRLAELQQLGVTAVVTLNQEFELFLTAEHYEELGIRHLWLPTTDYMFAPSLADLHRGVDFISEHARQGGRVYVHCKAGRGRSATLLLCYLAKERGMLPAEAFQFVKAKRPQIGLSRAQWEAVEQFWASLSPQRTPGTPLPAPAGGAAGGGKSQPPQAPGTPEAAEPARKQLLAAEAAATPSGAPAVAGRWQETPEDDSEDSEGAVEAEDSTAAEMLTWWQWVRSTVAAPAVAAAAALAMHHSEPPGTPAPVAAAAPAEGLPQDLQLPLQPPSTPAPTLVPAVAAGAAAAAAAEAEEARPGLHAPGMPAGEAPVDAPGGSNLEWEGQVLAAVVSEQGPSHGVGHAATAEGEGVGEELSWWRWVRSAVAPPG